jgi:hypothetical protein
VNLIIFLHPILFVKCLADKALVISTEGVAVLLAELLQFYLVAENNMDGVVLVESLTAYAVVIVLAVVGTHHIF